MKVAVSLSGLPRLSETTIASWSRIIGKYDADVYIHTWENGDKDLLSSRLVSIFNPISFQIENCPSIDISPYPDRHWPYIDVYRSLSMWTSIKRSYEMILPSTYDIIIRGRMDLYILELNLAKNDAVTIPWDPDKLPLKFKFREMQMNGYNDHFAYGPPKFMQNYINTFSEIYSLYTNDNVDYCPENFLAASLIKQNTPIIFQKLVHKLIRI